MRNEKFKYRKEKYFAVNFDDNALKPIYISLPEPPPFKYIDGFGLNPLQQTFKRLEFPPRLKYLETRVYREMDEWHKQNPKNNTITGYKILEKYWEIFIEEQDNYEKEIEFLKKLIYYSIHGYWCFIKGIAMFIPPWYFMFLNFYYIHKIHSYPEFRIEDLNCERFKWYLYNTKETFKYRDINGNALKNEQGKYEMIEMPYKVFYGYQELKRRRRGSSNRGLNNCLEITRTAKGRTGVILSDTGEHSEEHWKQRLIPAWQKTPLPLRPIWDGNNAPNRINYYTPANIYNQDSLKSVLYYSKTGGERAVDSDMVHVILLDENGKLAVIDGSQKWGVTKKTLAQGPKIHGWCEMPSTVEEMNEGGEEFKILWDNSNFYNRGDNGQTKSGLAREFIPAYRGYDNFIDHWGFAVVSSPTVEQIKYAKKDDYYRIGIGAKEYLLKERERLLNSKSPADQKEYRGMIRRDPIQSSECWLGVGGDVGFSLKIMGDRLADLRIDNYENEVIGNFEYVNGVEDGEVIFVENPKGKCSVSLLIGDHNICTNPKIRIIPSEIYKPNEIEIVRKYNVESRKYVDHYAPKVKSRFTMGIDPFKNLHKEAGGYSQTKLSDGGIAVFWHYDPKLDEGKDKYEAESFRFVLTYRNRPMYEEFMKDVVKIAKYYQAMMYIERNVEEFTNRIYDIRYAGYLKHKFNPNTNQFDAVAGGYGGGSTIDQIFNELREYFHYCSWKENHHELLEEGMNITGREKLTRHDLLAAAGWALVGSQSPYGQVIDNRKFKTPLRLKGTILQERVYRIK